MPNLIKNKKKKKTKQKIKMNKKVKICLKFLIQLFAINVFAYIYKYFKYLQTDTLIHITVYIL